MYLFLFYTCLLQCCSNIAEVCWSQHCKNTKLDLGRSMENYASVVGQSQFSCLFANCKRGEALSGEVWFMADLKSVDTLAGIGYLAPNRALFRINWRFVIVSDHHIHLFSIIFHLCSRETEASFRRQQDFVDTKSSNTVLTDVSLP